MRALLSIAFSLVFIGVLTPLPSRSADDTNGIYAIGDGDAGMQMTRSSGGSLALGSQVSDSFGEVSVWSLSNENDRFRVWMKQAGPFEAPSRLAIYVNGVCEVVNSTSGPDANGHWDLITDVTGLAHAEQVASALDVELQKRIHPGHQLRVTWRPTQEAFEVGEAVILELEIENVGETTVRFLEGGQQRGFRDNQFGFTAFAGSGFGKSIPDTGDPSNFGGIAALRELTPNDVWKKQVDLSKWFAFENADTYEVTGYYELEFRTQDFDARVLWEEFATGRCLVRIDE